MKAKIVITTVSNGFILEVVDSTGTRETAIATDGNLRGYSTYDLASVIESIVYRQEEREKPEVLVKEARESEL